ncbi:Pkinase-domain-containing protein [Rickenella mellea]|uniref:Pkinase-domain-containing protein n=1 Tax=Rickenella mellea TaxID=50990 RepID=A0A4Y7PK65_9AGAM|nr:Pkinase-domain-containing protein [Rickenella mellea]
MTVDANARERCIHQQRRLQIDDEVLGDYKIGKALHAGGTGDVKLAHHKSTGEKVIIKIHQRNALSDDNSSQQLTAKEIRTRREMSLATLLHHPNICATREVTLHHSHYYMVFEYVEGGNLLEYIIEHGRLRERVARKIARQIGSALEYCHRNNVVHRDLKIENILISKSGVIKISDFGLANLYNPDSHLSTFCGSSYFAAPELLNSQVYMGPEIDVWSFGVILYTLVCGRVPFDAENMLALQAKIKDVRVTYPRWLSTECNHLLQRIFVASPPQRASLKDVLSHKWMLRGFSSPPCHHLAHREPLHVNELDRSVFCFMGGFGFGSEEEIETRMREVLTGDPYPQALRAWERNRGLGNGFSGGELWTGTVDGTVSRSSLESDGTAVPESLTAIPNEKTRKMSRVPAKSNSLMFKLSVLGVYCRKILSLRPRFPRKSDSSDSRLPSAPSHPHLTGLDKTCSSDSAIAFHPLISIYYLAREKKRRHELAVKSLVVQDA